jgi:D-alanyl-D-alanine carboxypeptidase
LLLDLNKKEVKMRKQLTTTHHLKLLFITTLFAFILVACGGSGSGTVTPPYNILQTPVEFDYQELINRAISDIVPGIVLLVDSPEKTFLGSAGLANVEEQIPMETYHVMPNGSAGKKLTALLTVMLDEEGMLSLDDTIDNWLSEAILSQIENSEDITLRQLLNHTSGIRNYLDGDISDKFFQALLADPESIKTDSYALEFGLNLPAYFLPGEGYRYSNTGYLLVGLILDEVLGEHHSLAMRNRILIPFGMNSSFYNGIEKSLGEIISGYVVDDEYGEFDSKPYYENIGVADAPLSANVEDLALLLRMIVGPGDDVSPYVKDQLFGERYLVKIDESIHYGLGLLIETVNNKVVYHHNGLEPGYSTTNIYIPDSQTSITIFFNCGLSVQCENETDLLSRTVLFNEL